MDLLASATVLVLVFTVGSRAGGVLREGFDPGVLAGALLVVGAAMLLALLVALGLGRLVGRG